MIALSDIWGVMDYVCIFRTGYGGMSMGVL
jgi:hypothetical protein